MSGDGRIHVAVPRYCTPLASASFSVHSHFAPWRQSAEEWCPLSAESGTRLLFLCSVCRSNLAAGSLAVAKSAVRRRDSPTTPSAAPPAGGRLTSLLRKGGAPRKGVGWSLNAGAAWGAGACRRGDLAPVEVAGQKPTAARTQPEDYPRPELPQGSFLLQQKFCRNKDAFIRKMRLSRPTFCGDKHTFVVTKCNKNDPSGISRQ